MDIMKQIENYKINGEPWYAALENTGQNPIHHGEGSVWVHTHMVIDCLPAEPDFSRLSEADKRLLTLSAVLHDIAKPICTKVDNGELVSPNHAVRGEIEARKLIYKYGFMEEIFGKLTFEEREQVCSLIRYHGLPTLFLEKPDMKRIVLRAACELNPQLLALLSTADVKGRICPDQDDLLEKIALFKSLFRI